MAPSEPEKLRHINEAEFSPRIHTNGMSNPPKTCFPLVNSARLVFTLINLYFLLVFTDKLIIHQFDKSLIRQSAENQVFTLVQKLFDTISGSYDTITGFLYAGIDKVIHLLPEVLQHGITPVFPTIHPPVIILAVLHLVQAIPNFGPMVISPAVLSARYSLILPGVIDWVLVLIYWIGTRVESVICRQLNIIEARQRAVIQQAVRNELHSYFGSKPED